MLTRLGLLALLASLAAQPAVERIYVKERTDFAGGASLGDAGPYEQITATVHFRLDPKLPQNRAIVDLELAPVNSEGAVEFSADLLVWKPRDPSKGNGTALIDVPNRGGMVVNSTFNRGDSGDKFLMQHGFTVVSIGWQWDVPDVPGRMGLRAPRLPTTITGLVRSEFVTDKRVPGFSLGDRDHVPYPVADTADNSSRMYMREGPGLPRREVPRTKWRFPNKSSVEVDGGCEPGKIYEVVYRATGAVPVGLGFAAVRDIASFFKYGESPFLLGDQHRFIKRTIGFGVSQTGRFLRHMMYQGFNQDEKSRKVLDGVWAHVAGAGRGGFNSRFAQPSRDGQALLHYSWPVDLFPFADTELTDPLSGRTDALLTKAKEQKVAPKIFYTNNSYEYWGRAASLIHTTPDGARDVAPDTDTRIYFLAGGQHGTGTPLPLLRSNTQNVENPLDTRWAMRALLIAINDWLTNGTEPPPSTYPHVANGELVRAEQVKYPAEIHAPRWPRTPLVLGFTSEPPQEGKAYTVLLPQVDRDGNEVGGVRLPEIQVPLGIYTGWNLRAPTIGSPDRMIAFKGSFFPIAPPQRKSRYETERVYLDQYRKAAELLAEKRFLLSSDMDAMVKQAKQLWEASAASLATSR